MTSKIWGGRFSAGPSAIMEEINVSVGFDQRLAKQDLHGSRAHCAMLVAQGIVSQEDGDAIQEGLTRIEKEISGGNFLFKRALEDVHMNIEGRLADLIGAPAGRLHTARSRNDQVATDFRMWVRAALETLDDEVRKLQSEMIDKAEAHADTIMPGFTHLQAAQPVTFGHHLMAYVEMFGRDRSRMADARKRLNECPLGAGALAGTSFPIDRHLTAEKLNFDRPMANSMDAVSDRDFALDFLAAAAILSTHMSRLAEEMVNWSSAQFGFIRFSDAFSTGSSMMPQKRNPDAAELVRGKTGRIYGALVALLTVMKGLPLTYSKDMQEDKETVFATFDTMELCLAATTGMVVDMKPNAERMLESAAGRFHHRHRSGRLADPGLEHSLPRVPPHHRQSGEAGRGQRLPPVRPVPGRNASRRAAHHAGCIQGTDPGRLRRQPQQLRRHGAVQRARPSQSRARTLSLTKAAHMTSFAKRLLLTCMTVVVVAGMSGCGKKAQPIPPDGATYPRQYPNPEFSKPEPTKPK